MEASMPSTTSPLPIPVIPPEVLAFAAEQGAAAYLPAVVEMTRRIFPTAPIAVFVEEDPEIADDRHIVLEVQVPQDTGVEELVTTHRQWVDDIFRHCPATHVCVFRLGVVAAV
jgi:hypothetical protein